MTDPWREISTSWQGGTVFQGTNKDGAQVQIGKLENQAGFNPMETVLLALAACSGDDVLSILKKKRREVTGLKINARGKRAENPPKVYTEIHVEYIVPSARCSAGRQKYPPHLGYCLQMKRCKKLKKGERNDWRTYTHYRRVL